MTRIQPGQKFLSQDGIVEVIDNPSDITINGKGTVIESDGYIHIVTEWHNPKYPDVPYVEKGK